MAWCSSDTLVNPLKLLEREKRRKEIQETKYNTSNHNTITVHEKEHGEAKHYPATIFHHIVISHPYLGHLNELANTSLQLFFMALSSATTTQGPFIAQHRISKIDFNFVV